MKEREGIYLFIGDLEEGGKMPRPESDQQVADSGEMVVIASTAKAKLRDLRTRVEVEI